MTSAGIPNFEQYLERIRTMVDERLIPAEETVESSGTVPDDIRQLLFAEGLGGLSIDTDHGGLGATMEQECRVVFELGRASGAFRTVVGTNNGVGSQAIAMAGTPRQRQRYLPDLASGRIIGAFCLSEPEAGSDAGALQTTATLQSDGAGYRLDGTKSYVTNGPDANLFTVIARTGSTADGTDGISAFLVPATTPGLERGPRKTMMGLTGAGLCDLHLRNCIVPSDALLGEAEGNGFRTAMQVLDRSRLHLAALCVGASDRLIAEMSGHAVHRQQFGRPLAAFQQIQSIIADSYAENEAARALVRITAHDRDAGAVVPVNAAAAKLLASETAGRIADRAVQVHGGAGYTAGHVVERFFRDIRLYRILEGTSEIQRIVIARSLTGKTA